MPKFSCAYPGQHPKLAKQLIGLSLPQLEKLIQQAIAIDGQRKEEAEKDKIRVNKKGAGRGKNLSADEEICLTLFYLRQMTIFEVLGMMERCQSNNCQRYLSLLAANFTRCTPI